MMKAASVLSLTQDSQIGANLRICADEEDRADFDQHSSRERLARLVRDRNTPQTGPNLRAKSWKKSPVRNKC
jgi:hypothetical protein